MTVEAIHVFNAYIFECCNDSNYIDMYIDIIHIYIVFFIQSMGHTVTHLGHVYRHHLARIALPFASL